MKRRKQRLTLQDKIDLSLKEISGLIEEVQKKIDHENYWERRPQVTLRVPIALLEEMDIHRKSMAIKISRNQWMLEAFVEKLISA